MRIALASDHAGFALKEYLKPRLAELGIGVVDCGSYTPEMADYVDYTLKVVWQLAAGVCDRGILACGNGFAMAMLANRVPGMRAAVCHDAFTARTCTETGNANIISLGSRVIGDELAWDLVRIWLNTEFVGDAVPRYVARLQRVAEVEQLLAAADWREALERYVQRLQG